MRVLKNMRRHFRNIKKRRTFGESLHFLVQNWRWSFKASQKKNFLEYASSWYALEDYQKMTSRKTTLQSLWGLFQKPYTNRDSLQKQRKKQRFFNAKFHDIYQSLGARDVFGSRSKSPKWWPQVSYTWPWWPQKNQRTFVVCVLWWLRKNKLSTVWWICCAQSSWQSWIKSFQFSVLRLDSWALSFAKFWTCSRCTGCICAAPFL